MTFTGSGEDIPSVVSFSFSNTLDSFWEGKKIVFGVSKKGVKEGQKGTIFFQFFSITRPVCD